eukprot:TRINITY_DN6380_c0_g1_i1.p1 TRINITY_DN6380_c0_g1~~TRINITY_DN6380_c0_g1_i1.p1  ORF type:complete len:162 (+),score=23.00 TRINITY_DN6380_c0_g1_i1:44-487(+)
MSRNLQAIRESHELSNAGDMMQVLKFYAEGAEFYMNSGKAPLPLEKYASASGFTRPWQHVDIDALFINPENPNDVMGFMRWQGVFKCELVTTTGQTFPPNDKPLTDYRYTVRWMFNDDGKIVSTHVVGDSMEMYAQLGLKCTLEQDY